MGVNSVNKQVSNPLPLADKDPMTTYVVNEMERYEQYHSDRFDESTEIYDLWLGKPPSREFTWQNAVHVPMTFEAEQTITPRIFSALFPNEAPVDMVVYGDATEEEGITIRDHIRHHFRISDVQGKALTALTQCSLLGTGYLESHWLFRQKWQVGKDGKRYKATTDNRPNCETVSFFEIFPHPAKVSMGDGMPLIRRRYCDAEFIKRLAQTPQFKFDKLSEALASECPTPEDSPILDENGKTFQSRKREQYELLEYWGPWSSTFAKAGQDKVSESEAMPYWITIVNREVCVRGIPNPYNHQMPPFIKIKLFPDVENRWFGVGMGKIGKPTQERLNKIVNQRLDNVDLVLNKQGFYNGNDTLINTKKLQISKPGQWHKVSDTVTSIRWMEMPDVTASSYREEEIAKTDYRESTGATLPLLPGDEGQHRTASGIGLLQGAAGARFKPVLRKMEVDMIQELAMQYLSYLQQFMSIPEYIQKTGADGQKASVLVYPEMIQAKVLFVPTGLSEMLNKEFLISQLLQYKQVTMDDPTVNRAEINRRIAELMGFKDISKIIIQQAPAYTGPGMIPADMQMKIRQRLAEGATPDQIKMEMLGQPPGQGQESNAAPMASPA